MAQTYKVLQFKTGDFQDNYGNTWCDMVLEGHTNEPIRIVVKDPSQYHDGMELYGDIKEQTSKAGKPYKRFYKAEKPEAGSKPKYDSDGQRQGMAIKSAAEFVTKWADKKLSPQEFAQAVKPYATVLYEMELKVVTDANPKAEGVEVQKQPLSGYEKARTQANQLRQETTDDIPQDDAEFQSLIGTAVGRAVDSGSDINLDDIPF